MTVIGWIQILLYCAIIIAIVPLLIVLVLGIGGPGAINGVPPAKIPRLHPHRSQAATARAWARTIRAKGIRKAGLRVLWRRTNMASIAEGEPPSIFRFRGVDRLLSLYPSRDAALAGLS